MAENHRVNENTYLVEIINEQFPDQHRVIGLFHGHYRLLNKLPFELPGKLCYIRMIPFNHYSEQDELAEFRVLNLKDRVIVRSTQSDSAIVFGFEPRLKQFIVLENRGTMVFHGPLIIHQMVPLSPNIYATKDDDDDSQQQLKYSGYLTLNILGGAKIDFSNAFDPNDTVVQMFLPESSRYLMEKFIPYRFQQKSIVLRQQEKFQNCSSLTSLETFDHLLF